MDENLEQQLDRREFIRKITRYVISSGLVIATSILIFKRIKRSGNEKCINDFICQNCAKLSNCTIPHASSFGNY